MKLFRLGECRMAIEIEELQDQIKILKTELIQIALTTGLNSQDTICCSQKLDQLITIYQKHGQPSYRTKRIENCKVLLDASTDDSVSTTFPNEESGVFTTNLFEMPLFNLKQITQLCMILLNVNFLVYPRLKESLVVL